MTEIRLTNTMTHRKEVLRPLDPSNVRMYVCGPTVYDRAHLGNARPAVVFDMLFRLLRHVYGRGNVTYVRNITDVDDKIIDRARERGVDIGELTRQTTDWYREDMAALGTLPPTHEPRATEHVGDMVAMIRTLVERKHAYEAEGHVLFSVASDPDYGTLSGRSTDDMIAGARVEVAPYKRDPMDFVLWKPSVDDQPGWDSPWGRGRPGWHIECSAMARDLLGPAFDIHGGGTDLMFPHHENEIAQSNCAGDRFATIWMHNEMLQVEGRKMSKSLGNFFTVRDLLDQGWPGEVIRFVFLQTHYRSPMDWTGTAARSAMEELGKWYRFPGFMKAGKTPPVPEIIEALSDDLNTAEVMRVLRQLAKGNHYQELSASLNFLGFTGQWFFNLLPPQEISDRIRDLISELDRLRDAHDYGAADLLRAELVAAGVRVRSTPEGSEFAIGPDFDRAKLEALR